MADGTVTIRVTDNAQQSAKNFRALDKQLDNTEKSADDLSDSAKFLRGSLAAVGGVIATIGFTRLSSSLVKAASDAEETANKFNVVFRSIRQDADQAAEALADGFGLAGSEAQKLLSNTGDLLAGFGFTQDQALELSTTLNSLAVDLASFTNIEGGATRASAALTSALLGEREAIKSLGIAINEADIEQLAEDKGIVGELTRQQKAILTLELAVKQSGNAIGDFARSQESYANQARIFDAALTNLSETIGEKLLPFATEAIGVLTDLTNAWNGFFQSLDARELDGVNTEILETIETIKDLKSEIASGDVGFFDGIFGQSAEERLAFFEGRLEELASKRDELLGLGQDEQGTSNTGRTRDSNERDPVETVKRTEEATLESLSVIEQALQDVTENAGSDLASALTTPFQQGESAAQRFGSVVLNVLSQIAQKILTESLTGLFTSAVGNIGFGVQNAGVSASSGVSTADLQGAFANGGVFNGGKEVQAFANGGVVSSPTLFPMANGGTGLMGEAGAEAIMPLRRDASGRLGVEAAGGQSPTVNVFNQSGADIETVVRPDNEVDIFVKRVNGVLSSERGQNGFVAAQQRANLSGVQAG